MVGRLSVGPYLYKQEPVEPGFPAGTFFSAMAERIPGFPAGTFISSLAEEMELSSRDIQNVDNIYNPTLHIAYLFLRNLPTFIQVHF
ncbi:MAG: hypothetical protein AMS27_13700 [Bacteroides sp. SM23_62_1]|nr:MAG: hypothetical protein AMS27_13700 [Bacteroides sp. SM23_62_1]